MHERFGLDLSASLRQQCCLANTHTIIFWTNAFHFAAFCSNMRSKGPKMVVLVS
jgi:hypothetical protein